MTPETFVLFGKPGSGKDQASELIAREFDYTVLYGDRLIRGDYLDKLRSGTPPPAPMREAFVHSLTQQAKKLTQDPLVVNYFFGTRNTQHIFREAFPDARWIYVDTPREIIASRLAAKERVGHPISDNSYALAVGDRFELPVFPYEVLYNDADIPTLSHRVRQLLFPRKLA